MIVIAAWSRGLLLLLLLLSDFQAVAQKTTIAYEPLRKSLEGVPLIIVLEEEPLQSSAAKRDGQPRSQDGATSLTSLLRAAGVCDSRRSSSESSTCLAIPPQIVSRSTVSGYESIWTTVSFPHETSAEERRQLMNEKQSHQIRYYPPPDSDPASIAKLSAHIKALEVLAEGDEQSWGLILEEGKVSLNDGACWACRPKTIVSTVDSIASHHDWHVIQLSYQLEPKEAVKDLLTAAVEGEMIRPRDPCGVGQLLGGGGVYAISTTGANLILNDLRTLSSIEEEIVWDAKHLQSSSPDDLLLMRQKAWISTCPFFVRHNAIHPESASMLREVQTWLIAKNRQRWKRTPHEQHGQEHYPAVTADPINKSDFLFLGRMAGRRFKATANYLPTKELDSQDRKLAAAVCDGLGDSKTLWCEDMMTRRFSHFHAVCRTPHAAVKDSHSFVFDYQDRLFRIDFASGRSGGADAMQRFFRHIGGSATDNKAEYLVSMASKLDTKIDRAQKNEVMEKSLDELGPAAQHLAIFWHIGAFGPYWPPIVEEQIEKLDEVGLIDAARAIQVVTVGPDSLSKVASDPKFNIINLGTDGLHQYEFPALTRLQNYCHEHQDASVLYLHTKGSWSVGNGLDSLSANTDWRHYLEYFAILRYKECLEALSQGFDSCGVNHVPPVDQWTGNFYWARCDYINLLPPISSLNWTIRHNAQYWIGMAKEGLAPVADCHRNFQMGSERLRPEEYIGDLGCGFYLPL